MLTDVRESFTTQCIASFLNKENGFQGGRQKTQASRGRWRGCGREGSTSLVPVVYDQEVNRGPACATYQPIPCLVSVVLLCIIPALGRYR